MKIYRAYWRGRRVLADDLNFVLYPGCGGWFQEKEIKRIGQAVTNDRILVTHWGCWEKLWTIPIIAWVYMGVDYASRRKS